MMIWCFSLNRPILKLFFRGSILDDLIIFAVVFHKYDDEIVFVFVFDKYDDERMSISDPAGGLLFDWSARLERISTNCQGHSQ